MPNHDSLTERIQELEQSIVRYQEVQRELKQAKEFSENLIETANAIVLILDSEAMITRINAAAERITGYSKDEVLGRNWIDTFIPEVIRESVRKVFADVIRSEGRLSEFKNPILTKSGEERIISWSNNIVRNADDEPVGVLSIGIDVTDQWQAESELRKSEARYRTIFETANDAIFLLRGQEVVDCNGRSMEMFGFKAAEEVAGWRPWDFSPEYQPDGETSKAKAVRLIDAASSGKSQFFNWQHKRMNGDLFDVEVSLTSVRMADEVFLLAVVRDVTEARRAENLLRSAVLGTSATTGREFFRSLAKHLAEGLGVESALVGELHDEAKPVVKSLAFWSGGKHMAGLTYDLAGTPCAEVIRNKRSFCYSDVQASFPDDHVLAQMGAHTYIGAPLVTSTDEVLGVLAVIHDKPIALDVIPHVESLLALFASRAVAEIERVRAEDRLLTAKERLQEESDALTQKNIALKQVLEHIEHERGQFRKELAGSVENLLRPVLDKLRTSEGSLSNRDIDHFEDALESIMGEDVDVFSRNLAKLSAREIQICEMIRNGLSSKEIADKLTISLETVSKHRESIRKKLQIKRSSVNLSTYLKSRPWPL